MLLTKNAVVYFAQKIIFFYFFFSFLFTNVLFCDIIYTRVVTHLKIRRYDYENYRYWKTDERMG